MIHLVFLSLATHRLTLLISQELGPYEIFKRLRKFIGIHEKEIQYEDEQGITVTVIEKQITNEFAAMIDCKICFSGWISLILSFIFVKKSKRLILNWLAVWGLVSIVLGLVNRHDNL